MSQKIKALRITHGQLFWYVEFKVEDGAGYRKDSRHATYEAAIERCNQLVKGA